MNGYGFELYGTAHILWLIICAAAITAAVFSFLRITDRKRSTAALKACAFMTLALHLFQSAYRIYEGSYCIGTLPLHLCAIASYLCFIHALTGGRILSELLFFPCMPGAACALIFPDWGMYPPFSVISATGFLSHAMIIMYVAMLLAGGYIRPKFSRIYIPAVFLAVYAALMIPFNRHFRTNYGFLISPPEGSPLMLIARICGSGAGYYIGYACLAVIVMLVFYAAYYVIRKTAGAVPDGGTERKGGRH